MAETAGAPHCSDVSDDGTNCDLPYEFPQINPVETDRLGSVRVRWNAAKEYSNPRYQDRFSYFPYGEEGVATTQDRTKFATYHRDGNTNLDYAMNRYYTSQDGALPWNVGYGDGFYGCVRDPLGIGSSVCPPAFTVVIEGGPHAAMSITQQPRPCLEP